VASFFLDHPVCQQSTEVTVHPFRLVLPPVSVPASAKATAAATASTIAIDDMGTASSSSITFPGIGRGMLDSALDF